MMSTEKEDLTLITAKVMVTMITTGRRIIDQVMTIEEEEVPVMEIEMTTTDRNKATADRKDLIAAGLLITKAKGQGIHLTMVKMEWILQKRKDPE